MSTRGDGAVAAATEHQAQADAAKSRKSWGETLSRRRIVLVLISVMLGMLLSALDQTIVGTALPKIVQTFPNGVEHYVWVTTGYLLAAAASMPIWGKLSDAYGRKPFYAAGMVIFVVGSALSGQAHTMTELIVFRAFQGLGAGRHDADLAGHHRRRLPARPARQVHGLLMSVFGLATIVGPLLGGWITDNFGWRWVFYVNLPVGIVAIAFCLSALPGHVAPAQASDRLRGLRLLVARRAAAARLQLGRHHLPVASWPVVGVWVFSAAAWVAFFLWEMRAREPVINPRLFNNRIFSVSSAASSSAAPPCSARSCSCRSSCRSCRGTRRRTRASSSCR